MAGFHGLLCVKGAALSPTVSCLAQIHFKLRSLFLHSSNFGEAEQDFQLLESSGNF